MDAFQLLEETGNVPPADDATIDAAVDLVHTAALDEADAAAIVPSIAERRHRRRVGFGGVAATAAAAALVLAVTVPAGHRNPSSRSAGSSTTPGHSAPALLSAATVRLIASRSAEALADSGTAVDTQTETDPSPDGTQVPFGTPYVENVTFSGSNVNYTFTSSTHGEAGVQDTLVNGQEYDYLRQENGQMGWETCPASSSNSLNLPPDPRTVVQAISPSAGLENLGEEWIDGMDLTHLRATTPGLITQPEIVNDLPPVVSLDVWVDSNDVVRQMIWSNGGNAPSHTVFITELQFANLGTPETITAPSGPILPVCFPG
jgi:hypothetical protein